ncbi:MFS general substrate transporter [Stereum hirsutum FP-91666 SS1]|uniref:MFS general substrate transporter n=1 Tax=Stereum hirsutum (strain FP-91666) TaxID=721885 RepID=UPI00044105BC|nr:MFS general substrate transporter [Stereum hirsutum FP-91666 SS1]EIM90192.1 MFS general substrate transporter [Stereum hirsutum FP-91666 SS1]
MSTNNYTDPSHVSQPTCNTHSHDETSTLLNHEQTPSLESQSTKNTPKTPTPLPYAQLACLCLVRTAEPINFTHIFPYVNQMLAGMHVTDDPSRIGFYSGVVESAFAVAQLCSIYQWARLSDVIGRKPVILAGILGMSIASLFFGLSKSLAGVILARCLAGLASGNAAVISSVLGELTDSTNQAIAFPIYGLTWPAGAIIGPLLGGALSNPAAKFPSLANNEFLRMYPYFLPGFVAATVSVTGVVFGYLFLQETLPSKRQKSEKSPSLFEETPASPATTTADCSKAEPPCVRTLLSIPTIRVMSTSGLFLAFASTAFDVTFVLFCYTPIQLGGLAFTVHQIGYSLAVSGFVAILLQIFITPIILARCDLIRVYNTCMRLWPWGFLAMPFVNLIARAGLAQAAVDKKVQALVWCGVAAVLAFTRAACLAYSISMILVKQGAPKGCLGVTNGIVQFSMCFARAFAPALASSVFAFSLDSNICGGYLWVIVMVAITGAGTILSGSLERSRKLIYADGANNGAEGEVAALAFE